MPIDVGHFYIKEYDIVQNIVPITSNFLPFMATLRTAPFEQYLKMRPVYFRKLWQPQSLRKYYLIHKLSIYRRWRKGTRERWAFYLQRPFQMSLPRLAHPSMIPFRHPHSKLSSLPPHCHPDVFCPSICTFPPPPPQHFTNLSLLMH